MTEEYLHKSVMAGPIVNVMKTIPEGWVIDCTLGGGGHSLYLLEAASQLSIVGFDVDETARKAAAKRLFKYCDRILIVDSRFDELTNVLDFLSIGQISGAIFDLGVSSPQLDSADRGFSHKFDGPLDMRMNQGSEGPTAYDVVNGTHIDELTDLLRRGGETRNPRRIAKKIVAGRPVDTTSQLSELILSGIPHRYRRKGGNPLNVAFQAIRIHVNSELEILEPALLAAAHRLVPGGRLAVVSFHGGEDQIVKRVLSGLSSEDHQVPRGLPVTGIQETSFSLVRGIPKRPLPDEASQNPRSTSARLRVIERNPNLLPKSELEALK